MTREKELMRLLQFLNTLTASGRGSLQLLLEMISLAEKLLQEEQDKPAEA